MANMSYCRWNNTNQDFGDCLDNMQWWLEDNPGKTWEDYRNQLNEYEQSQFTQLMKKIEQYQSTIEHYSKPEEEEEFDADSWIAEGERSSNEIDLAWSEMGLKSDH